jgi:hypothetical protein
VSQLSCLSQRSLDFMPEDVEMLNGSLREEREKRKEDIEVSAINSVSCLARVA